MHGIQIELSEICNGAFELIPSKIRGVFIVLVQNKNVQSSSKGCLHLYDICENESHNSFFLHYQ